MPHFHGTPRQMFLLFPLSSVGFLSFVNDSYWILEVCHPFMIARVTQHSPDISTPPEANFTTKVQILHTLLISALIPEQKLSLIFISYPERYLVWGAMVDGYSE